MKEQPIEEIDIRLIPNIFFEIFRRKRSFSEQIKMVLLSTGSSNYQKIWNIYKLKCGKWSKICKLYDIHFPVVIELWHIIFRTFLPTSTLIGYGRRKKFTRKTRESGKFSNYSFINFRDKTLRYYKVNVAGDFCASIQYGNFWIMRQFFHYFVNY